MLIWLSAGICLALFAIIFILWKWGNLQMIGVTPVKTLTFIAILFTSGLDVGLIMFPLTEFNRYATQPDYSFTNPLAIEFGFWGFLIWAFYFLTCFYFCIIEPKVKFFEIPLVKLINNIVIIGTCAFTAFLLLKNLPWYLPSLGDGETIAPVYYLIVFATIAFAVYSSTELKYVRILSLSSTGLFLALIAFMWGSAFLWGDSKISEYFAEASLIEGYFENIQHFLFPINDYHAVYLFWWFSWSIMIGQFTARFAGGLKTWQLLCAMLVFPSIPIALWFGVLWHYHQANIATTGIHNILMVVVGITFVINSLDSLIRLYTDNLKLSCRRLGSTRYFVLNLFSLCALTLFFKINFIQIQWVGSIVIALFYCCLGYILYKKFKPVCNIVSSPLENELNFDKFNLSH
ncbi:BCCT family transporter [Shewanella sp. YIC-542]|uniref:BCCT family transporter n=1 Tax=Shewanella mytili TaxID=3377111 RepID=UPI00398ED0E2